VSETIVRAAVDADLPLLTELYNHYVLNTPITFDTQPSSVDERRSWLHDHAPTGRHRLIVADAGPDGVVGYASSSRFRPRAAYDTTVEASVYCRVDWLRRGIGSTLYGALFEQLVAEDIHRIVACVTLPNAASVALHERFGFRQIGVLSSVGRKFDRYWDVAWFERPLRI
jgi:phosphinothricin acetyltransferase